MSRPRPVHPGATVLITRRTQRRRFFFVPKKVVRRIFGYALASAAAKHGVSIHAVMVMSNHYHAVVTDVHGVLPDFLRDFHKEVSAAINAHHGEWGSVWAGEQTSVVRLLSDEDVLDKMAYTLLNPVAAGLVESHADWPGLHSSPSSCARAPVVFERPKAYFDSQAGRPDKLELTMTAPPQLAHLSPSELADRLSRRVAQEEEAIQQRFAAEGRSFLGVDKVLRTSRKSQPTTWEKRRAINPTLAARDKEARRRQLAADRAWCDEYREALRLWREGRRDVRFPASTWLMVRYHDACCEPETSLRSAA